MRRSLRQILVTVCLASVLFGVGCERCGSGASKGEPEPTATGNSADPAAGPVGTGQGRFVGSAACASCHEEIARAWQGSRHRGTLRTVGPQTRPRLTGATLPEGYAVDGGGSVRGPGLDGEQVSGIAAYVVGGRHREDLWVRMDDGRLQVYPIAFDIDGNRAFEPLRELAGGNSPPADTVDHWLRFGRNADFVCYGCHATGQVLVNAGPSIESATPRSRWVEAGVGCEACHGAGGEHVLAAQAKSSNVGKLRMAPGVAGEEAVAACAGCHGLRDPLSSPFADFPAQSYGEPVWARADALPRFPLDFEFRDAAFADLRPATYQQEAIALGQTGCVRRGGLTCATCHDPHSGNLTATASGADGGDSTCVSCHAEVARQGRAHTQHEPNTPGARCFDCHLAPIVRGPGAHSARDHSLAAPSAPAGEIPPACDACHTPAKNDAVERAWRSRGPTSPSVARRDAIARAVKSAVQGAAVRELGTIAGRSDESWYLRSTALRLVLPILDAGGGGEAAPGARAALASNHPAVRRVAVRILARAGDQRDLEAISRLAEDSDPFMALEATLALAALRDPGAGPRLTRVVRRPDLLGEYRAHLELGREALAARDWERAETSMMRALQLNPFIVPAWNDLGIARFSSGSTPTARAAWERALFLNPRFEATRRNLDATATP